MLKISVRISFWSLGLTLLNQEKSPDVFLGANQEKKDS